MKHRIFKLTEVALRNELSWDFAIYVGEIETVKEFNSLSDALFFFEVMGFDTDFYGVE